MRSLHVLLVVGGLVAFTTSAVHAAVKVMPPPVTSQSSYTVSSPLVGGTVTVPMPYFHVDYNGGDWWVTPKAAHASFYVADQRIAKLGEIDMVLNGAPENLIGKAFILNHDNVTLKGGGRPADEGFLVRLFRQGKATYLYPQTPGDELTITVTKMDMLHFEATFSGKLTDGDSPANPGPEARRVPVTGTISLQRGSAPMPLNAGEYFDCDPIVHDYDNGGIERSTSECEIKFDRHVRIEMNKAFAPVDDWFRSKPWIVPDHHPDEPTMMIPRGDEDKPSAFEGFGTDARMNPASPEYRQLKAASETPDPTLPQSEALEKLTAALRDLRGKTEVQISARINLFDREIINFRGQYTVTPLPGGGWVISAPEAQPGTGGNEGQNETFVLLGPWSQPAGTAQSDGSTRITAKAKPNPAAPRLSTQTIVVTIISAPELAQQVIQRMDWNQMRTIVANR